MALKKTFLNVNGVERFIVFDEDKDTLATVLRNLGCTGVKVGCGTGQCGSCSVLLDGEVVRSCTRKMKNVKEYSNVVTIEGIGTPTNLHPLQLAWIVYGGVQCGFCTPGFIMSAVEILESGKLYTRDELRKLLSGHLCRCTGYENILNAVEKTMKKRLAER
jgi:Aerobic-type carbon monoxide dehydrogenase, small subunit CoxS/CutS homologs